jgi:hypothetical protein
LKSLKREEFQNADFQTPFGIYYSYAPNRLQYFPD